MSNTLNLQSLPVVAMYLPQREMAREVTGADGWAKRVTTGLDPMLGVHIVTSPDWWATLITAFYTF